MPATLALTLGAPASFGAFTPGVAQEYTASTTATVISTAGDATLTVADPSTTNTGKLVNGAFALAQPLQGLGVVKTWNAPTSNEVGPGHVQAADRRQRAAAHGHVQQDADVHPEHDHPVVITRSIRPWSDLHGRIAVIFGSSHPCLVRLGQAFARRRRAWV